MFKDNNDDNNTTGTIFVDTVTTKKLRSRNITIGDGYISGLLDPVDPKDIATKQYVDAVIGGGSSEPSQPLYSVQYNNNGTFGGSEDLVVVDPGLPTETLYVGNKLSSGPLTIENDQIYGLQTVNVEDSAVTKTYVDVAGENFNAISVIINHAVGKFYTPEEVYDTIIEVDFTETTTLGNCPIDALPLASEMANFLGDKFVVGKSWKTLFVYPTNGEIILPRFIINERNIESNSIRPMSHLFLNMTLPIAICSNYSNIMLISIVTNDTPGSEAYVVYILSNGHEFDTNVNITDNGVLTPSFGIGTIFGLEAGVVVHPVKDDPTIDSDVTYVYSYDNLRQYFIVRKGLIGDTEDSFEDIGTILSHSDFSMGSGTFTLFIQNPTEHTLTLIKTGLWDFDDVVVPSGNCVHLWITINNVVGKIDVMGISAING